MKIKKFILGTMQTNCYMIINNCDAILVDPGSDASTLINYIESNNYNLQAILLTHGHFDHIGALDELYNKYRCNIYLNKNDHKMLVNSQLNLSYFVSEFTIAAPVLELPKDLIISDISFSCINLPGHCPGSSIIILPEERIIFSGDVLFKMSIGRFDFEGSSETDTIKTIHYLKNMTGDYTIYPGHGEKTTLKFEQLNNPYLKS